MHQDEGNRVKVLLEIDMVVNVQSGGFAGGILVGFLWQWPQGRLA
jgi:hypothetical protein